MSFRRFLLVACAIVGLLVTPLWVFWPGVPRSMLGWMLLVVLGLPASLFIEWLGDASLSARFWTRLSMPMRVLLGVPAMLAMLGVTAALVWSVRWVVVHA